MQDFSSDFILPTGHRLTQERNTKRGRMQRVGKKSETWARLTEEELRDDGKSAGGREREREMSVCPLRH